MLGFVQATYEHNCFFLFFNKYNAFIFYFYFELFCLNLSNKYSQRLMDCVQVVATIKLMYKEAKKQRKHKNNHKCRIRWTISQPAPSLSTLPTEKDQTLSTCYNLLIILTFLTPTVCTVCHISIYSESTYSLPARAVKF